MPDSGLPNGGFCRPEMNREGEKPLPTSVGFHGPHRGPFCLRFHFPNGEIPAQDFLTLMEAARSFAMGRLRITLRQGIEIQDVPSETVTDLVTFLGNHPHVFHALYAHRLPACCPLADSCPNAAFDVRPWTQLFSPPDPFFKIGFSSCGMDCGLAGLAELGFVAEIRNGFEGFSVYTNTPSGNAPTQKLLDWIPATSLLRFKTAYRKVLAASGFRDEDSTPRLQPFLSTIGLKAFQSLLLLELGLREHQGWKQIPARVSPQKTDQRKIENVGNCHLFQLTPSGKFAVELLPPTGELGEELLEEIARILKKHPVGVRLGLFQNLYLPDLSESEARSAAMRFSGGSSTPRDPQVYLLGCVGSAICSQAVGDSRTLASEIQNALAQTGFSDSLNGLILAVSGCNRACTRFHFADLGFVAESRVLQGKRETQYAIHWGGGAELENTVLAAPLGSLPAEQIPLWVKDVVQWVGGNGIALRDVLRTPNGKEAARRLLRHYTDAAG